MEAVSPPGLTWVTEPIPDCLACNGAVEPEEANLAVAGADDSPDARGYLAVMGRCQECGRWYGLLDTLSEVAEHEDYDSADAMRAFFLDEEGGRCVAGTGNRSRVVDRLSRATDPRS